MISRSQPLRSEAEIADGSDRTILIVEVGDSGINWMEPHDLNFDEMSFAIDGTPRKSISAEHREGGRWLWSRDFPFANVLMHNGVVARLARETPPETIRALLTCNGGEKVDVPTFQPFQLGPGR